MGGLDKTRAWQQLIRPTSYGGEGYLHTAQAQAPVRITKRKFYSDFNTVCLLCLSCCLLLVQGFPLLVFDDENVLFAEIQPIQDIPSQ